MSTSPFQFTRRQTLAGVVAALATPLGAWAQSDKPVKFILPVSAGSGVDGIARAAQNALSKALGQASHEIGSSHEEGLKSEAVMNPPPGRGVSLITAP